jgi:hypothetical protein
MDGRVTQNLAFKPVLVTYGGDLLGILFLNQNFGLSNCSAQVSPSPQNEVWKSLESLQDKSASSAKFLLSTNSLLQYVALSIKPLT